MGKNILLTACALTMAVMAAGCETVKGIGRDITGASTSVQESFSNGKSR